MVNALRKEETMMKRLLYGADREIAAHFETIMIAADIIVTVALTGGLFFLISRLA
jgi:hypothetical protein